jgi:putative DNA primase/helicase
MGCGKTRYLKLLSYLCPNPWRAICPTPAALYRYIEATKPGPTLLVDEAQQAIDEKGSELARTLYAIFCAGTEKDAILPRCVPTPGGGFEPYGFPIYCPKALARIGKPEGVLEDRCLFIQLERKTEQETILQDRMRKIEARGKVLKERLEGWASDESVMAKAAGIYDALEKWKFGNDRIAEFLLPLQAVLDMEGEHAALDALEGWIQSVEESGRKIENQQDHVRLLAACRDIFMRCGREFFPTEDLINFLVDRDGEPWSTYTGGIRISAFALAKLFRKFEGYDIKPQRNKEGTHNGYSRARQEKAWPRYLPPYVPPTIASDAPSYVPPRLAKS